MGIKNKLHTEGRKEQKTNKKPKRELHPHRENISLNAYSGN